MKPFNALLNKELRLALHPTSIIFLSLSFMLLIPNYPLYVTFFYTGLGIFFICLSGRENHDIFYTLLLPVKKGDAVKGRFFLIILVEAIQFLIAFFAAFIRNTFEKLPNQAGMDANPAFFGLAFILMGIFNYSFLTHYYKNTAKIGRAFAISSIYVWIYIIAAEACSFAIPFFHNVLDTPDPEHMMPKMAVFAIGLILFIITTFLAEKKSVKLFEKSDF